MTSFKEYATYFILTGLFLIAIINGGIQLARNNDVSQNVIDTEQSNLSALTKKLDLISDTSEGWRKSFQSDNPLTIGGNLIVQSIWSIGVLIFNSVLSVFIIISNVAYTTLGIPNIVSGIILTIIIIGMILATWRLMRAGE